MVYTRTMNALKMMLFLLVLTIVLVFAAPFLMPSISVGLLMFLEPQFWAFFVFILGVWFIFGVMMYIRGYGKKGDQN